MSDWSPRPLDKGPVTHALFEMDETYTVVQDKVKKSELYIGDMKKSMPAVETAAPKYDPDVLKAIIAAYLAV